MGNMNESGGERGELKIGLTRRAGMTAPRNPAFRNRSSRVCGFGIRSGEGEEIGIFEAAGATFRAGSRDAMGGPSGNGWA